MKLALKITKLIDYNLLSIDDCSDSIVREENYFYFVLFASLFRK